MTTMAAAGLAGIQELVPDLPHEDVTQTLWPSSTALPGIWGGLWMSSVATRSWISACMLCCLCRRGLYLRCHSTTNPKTVLLLFCFLKLIWWSHSVVRSNFRQQSLSRKTKPRGCSCCLYLLVLDVGNMVNNVQNHADWKIRLNNPEGGHSVKQSLSFLLLIQTVFEFSLSTMSLSVYPLATCYLLLYTFS